LDDPNSEVAKLMASGKAEVLHPEYALKEKVAYIGVPKRFIAGAVVFGDTDECGEGAKVTLEGKGMNRAEKANNYGDFEFDGLSGDKAYVIKVEHGGYKTFKTEVETKTDVYLGDIVLTKRTETKKK
jgi:hypothetical protein